VPGLVIEGMQLEVPGLRALSWLDEPELRLKMPEDGQKRWKPPHSLCLHTTMGILPAPRSTGVKQRPARPEECTGRRTVNAWRHEKRQASGALIVDADATILSTCDVVEEMSYHCPHLNIASIGIEVVQQPDGDLFSAQLSAVVTLCTLLCGVLRIPKRVIWPFRGPRPILKMQNFLGVFGHRDADNNRGRGDPGDVLIQALVAAGFVPSEPPL